MCWLGPQFLILREEVCAESIIFRVGRHELGFDFGHRLSASFQHGVFMQEFLDDYLPGDICPTCVVFDIINTGVRLVHNIVLHLLLGHVIHWIIIEIILALEVQRGELFVIKYIVVVSIDVRKGVERIF